VNQLHNEFKLKLFDGIMDNLDDGQSPNVQREGSLDLNFDREKGFGQNKKPAGDAQNAQWNDV